MKHFFSFLGMALLGGILTLAGYKAFVEKEMVYQQISEIPMVNINSNLNPTIRATSTIENTTDFTIAAESTVHAVVHVKNTAVRTQKNPWAELFYGNGNGSRKYEQVGTGSGVIISQDGYIVTNNHVIESATDIEITLNNRKKHKATLIGTDPSNDIALLKINTGCRVAIHTFCELRCCTNRGVGIGCWKSIQFNINSNGWNCKCEG